MTGHILPQKKQTKKHTETWRLVSIFITLFKHILLSNRQWISFH